MGYLNCLADRPQQSRPIYGDVHTQPHNYNEFVRQMQDDKRRRAGGGY